MWAIGATAITPGPLHRDAAGVLEQTPVQQTMANRVAAAIVAQVPMGGAVDPAVLGAVADATLEQPAFVAAFAEALDQIQQHVMDGTVNPITLDPVLVAQAARAASAGHPELVLALAAEQPILVGVPDARRAGSLAVGRPLAGHHAGRRLLRAPPDDVRRVAGRAPQLGARPGVPLGDRRRGRDARALLGASAGARGARRLDRGGRRRARREPRRSSRSRSRSSPAARSASWRCTATRPTTGGGAWRRSPDRRPRGAGGSSPWESRV